MSALLLKTKFHIPTTRPEIVARPRLLNELSQTLMRKLTLLSAPAGFGKTTLLAEWLATTGKNSAPRIAWVTLEEDDNDPARFWAYVFTAFETAQTGTGDTALELLHAPQPSPIESILTELINELAGLDNNFILALDDYHVIHTPTIHAGLQYLLEHLPSNLHLVLTTRNDPPLPLAQLRARRQMIELRAADLRFTLAEAAAFLNMVMQLNLSDADIAALETRTEGWIASLQLAALAMQSNRTMQGNSRREGRQDVSDFIASFTGSNRYIISYLVEQVLNRQREAVQEFLLQTSILARMNADLCGAVTQRHDSNALLAHLDANNLFIVPLDDAGEWYRYHKLFADVLQNRLQKTQPALVPELHRRASAWFAARELTPEAIEHSLMAKEYDRAAELIDHATGLMFRRGEHKTIQGWLDRLPREVILAHPQLSLTQAGAYARMNRMEQAEKYLAEGEAAAQSAQIDAARRTALLGEAAVIRASIAIYNGDAPRAIELATQALAQLPLEKLRQRGQATLHLGLAYHWSGNLAEASRAYMVVSRISLEADDLYTVLVALSNQMALLYLQGHLHQVEQLYKHGIKLIQEHGAHDLASGGIYRIMARVYYEWNDLDAAERQVTEAISRSEHEGNPRFLVLAQNVLARLLYAQGDTAGALAASKEAVRLVREHNLSTRYASAALGTQAWLWLATGDIDSATAWGQSSNLRIGAQPDLLRLTEWLSLMHLLLVKGMQTHALDLLKDLKLSAEADGRVGDLIEILALTALMLDANDEHAATLATLERALMLAEPEGFIRTFVDEGERMKFLISDFRSLIEKRPSNENIKLLLAYTQKLLDAFDSSPMPSNAQPLTSNLQLPISNPLTDRELAILRLMAAGHTNPEIGDALVIAVGTVKKYTNTIFSKLGVTNRTQAVVRARELGLL